MPETAAEPREFVTRDLSLAAFLAEHGLILRRADQDPRTGHFCFVLEDPRGESGTLKIDWSNSCCRKHESRVLSLKQLLRSGPNGDGRR